ncbi:MAG: hypothetical protein ABH821_01855 [archaeon]
MRTRTKEFALSGEDWIYTKTIHENHELKNITIIYYAKIENKTRQVFRIDCSHGFLHKHLL